MIDRDISERILEEEIKAEVEKSTSRLIFGAFVLFLLFIAFWIKQCANEPNPPDPSVECFKAGGQWVPETKGMTMVNGYCSLKK